MEGWMMGDSETNGDAAEIGGARLVDPVTEEEAVDSANMIMRHPAPHAAPPMGPSPGYRKVVIDHGQDSQHQYAISLFEQKIASLERECEAFRYAISVLKAGP